MHELLLLLLLLFLFYLIHAKGILEGTLLLLQLLMLPWQQHPHLLLLQQGLPQTPEKPEADWAA